MQCPANEVTFAHPRVHVTYASRITKAAKSPWPSMKLMSVYGLNKIISKMSDFYYSERKYIIIPAGLKTDIKSTLRIYLTFGKLISHNYRLPLPILLIYGLYGQCMENVIPFTLVVIRVQCQTRIVWVFAWPISFATERNSRFLPRKENKTLQDLTHAVIIQ